MRIVPIPDQIEQTVNFKIVQGNNGLLKMKEKPTQEATIYYLWGHDEVFGCMAREVAPFETGIGR